MSRGLGRVQRAVLAYLEEEASYPSFRPERYHRLCVLTQVTEYHPESLVER